MQSLNHPIQAPQPLSRGRPRLRPLRSYTTCLPLTWPPTVTTFTSPYRPILSLYASLISMLPIRQGRRRMTTSRIPKACPACPYSPRLYARNTNPVPRRRHVILRRRTMCRRRNNRKLNLRRNPRPRLRPWHNQGLLWKSTLRRCVWRSSHPSHP